MKKSLPQTMKKQHGFTLVELMIAIVIAAILIGIALPSFTSSIENARIKTQANNLFTSLVTARSEAVKRNQPAIMCKSDDGSSCDNSLSWSDGWLVYVDEDGDGNIDAPGEVVTSYSAAPANITITTGGNDIEYRSDGAVVALGDTFKVCATGDSKNGYSVIVSTTGRPRTEKITSCNP